MDSEYKLTEAAVAVDTDNAAVAVDTDDVAVAVDTDDVAVADVAAVVEHEPPHQIFQTETSLLLRHGHV